MAELVSSIRGSKFVKNVLALMGGKGVEALIGFGCMPVVTRIFAPETYGVAAGLIAMATLLMPIATLSYENGILLTKNSTQEITLSRIVFYSSIAFSMLLLIFLWINQSLELFNFEHGLSSWLWVVPIYVVLRAVLTSFEQMLIKRNEFKWLASSGVFNVSVAMAVRLSWGALHGSLVVILVVAYAVGLLAKVILCGLTIPGLKNQFKTIIGYKQLITVAKEFNDFPRFQMFGALFRSAANNLPVTLFAAIYSPAVAGVYAMSLAISRRPLEMILTSYRSVFLKRSTELQNHAESLKKLFLQHTFLILFFGGVIFAIIFWVSPKLCPLLLGLKWAKVGNYIQIMTPWLFSLLLSLPAVSIYIVIRKQKIWAMVSIVTAVLQILSILVGKFANVPIESVLWAYSGIGTIAAILLVFTAERLLSKETLKYER